MKTCAKCKAQKPLSEFSVDRHSKDGRQYHCRDCRSAYWKQWRKDNPAKSMEYFTRWHEKRMGIGGKKAYELKRVYGISFQEYQSMLSAQKHCCKICEEKMKKPVVDHDHKTKKVRGLLCQPCNLALGALKDSPTRCYRAAGYLLSHSAPVDETFVGDAGC